MKTTEANLQNALKQVHAVLNELKNTMRNDIRSAISPYTLKQNVKAYSYTVEGSVAALELCIRAFDVPKKVVIDVVENCGKCHRKKHEGECDSR